MTLDLGNYRGPWQLVAENGQLADKGDCFKSPRCKHTIAAEEGPYDLIFSGQPQSINIRFVLKSAGVTLVSGSDVAEASGNTLRLKLLKPVTIVLNGYLGPWALELWETAKKEHYFRTDGREQTLDLIPLTTYALSFGATISERFRIGLDGKILLIDEKGSVTADPDNPQRLLVNTIDVVVYPTPDTSRALWNVGFDPPAPGRSFFEGALIVRLVEGSTYQLATADEGPSPGPREIATGKSCSMYSQTLAMGARTFHFIPIHPSCVR
jgi:hypothetical protein